MYIYIYSILLNDIAKYSRLGNIIIQGYFNAYTNTQPGFILFDNDSHCVNDDDFHYQHDNTLSRNNLDHNHTTNSGKRLLNMCKESGIWILNGRMTGDLVLVNTPVSLTMGVAFLTIHFPPKIC